MTEVIGHRGWPSRFPDNTLSGFRAAATVADGVELDVRRSADGKLVLSHDPDLGGFEIASHPYEILVELDLGGGHRPALLDEVVAALPGTKIQFEVKNLPHQPGFEPDHRVGLEAASRARSDDVVTSFYWPTLDAVRRSFSDVATGVLLEAHTDINRGIEHSLDNGHGALVLEDSMIDEQAVELIAASGLDSYAWTVNDPARAIELAGFGVSGIITNDPGLMAETLGSIQ